MKREEKLNEIRTRLIEGTIRVIAEEGLDKASTKQIGIAAATNEAYIYRCFESKEDMFARTFAEIDKDFVETALQHVDVMYRRDVEYEVRCHNYFSKLWEFFLGNGQKCLAYVQYYYSPYFTKYSFEEHKARFFPLVTKFSDAFKEEAAVWLLLNHIFNVMLDFAVKVYHGQMPNDDDHAEHVFRVVYRSIEQYFKDKKERNSKI